MCRYADAVSEPIDLRTIKERAISGAYSSADTFMDALRLMRSNAVAFNGENHACTEAAQSVIDKAKLGLEASREVLDSTCADLASESASTQQKRMEASRRNTQVLVFESLFAHAEPPNERVFCFAFMRSGYAGDKSNDKASQSNLDSNNPNNANSWKFTASVASIETVRGGPGGTLTGTTIDKLIKFPERLKALSTGLTAGLTMSLSPDGRYLIVLIAGNVRLIETTTFQLHSSYVAWV